MYSKNTTTGKLLMIQTVSFQSQCPLFHAHAHAQMNFCPVTFDLVLYGPLSLVAEPLPVHIISTSSVIDLAQVTIYCFY